jgi:hypothetical protein
MQRAIPAVLAGVVLLAARGAYADDAVPAEVPLSPEACVDAHVAAQRAMRAAHLSEARTVLLQCSRNECPSVLVSECSQWLREVGERMPSVVIAAEAPDGRDVTAVRTLMDGKLLTDRVDGKELEVDPGVHRFRYELAGARPVEQSVVIRERERGRKLRVDFGAVESAATPSGPPASVYILGGVGVAGIAAFSIFGSIGLSQKSDLDDSGCKPNCSSDDVDRVRRSFLIGDIALGVGVVALSVATVIYLTSPKGHGAEQKTSGRKLRRTALPDMALGYRF